MEISKVKLHDLRNEEHYSFHNETAFIAEGPQAPARLYRVV